ncbi:MAG: LytR family transcriptional regulator [Thermoleophilia bacterium]|nr:LytR family transcriptional regulator [Thermoleophilia bacterium]
MHRAATISARMPEQQKPYRVYRGGRAKGKVPLQRPPRGQDGKSSPKGKARTPRQRRPGRRITLVLLVLIVLGVVWLGTSYLSFSRGISEANARVPARMLAELARQKGLLTSSPTTILVLGTDGGTGPGRGNANRSDSVMLIRTDPRKHRLAFLSIPRDLRVEIPGHGAGKINAAFQYGGPTLALRTVKDLTGLQINHVAFVNFDRFRELIDSVGGVAVDVPRPILSNRFDCPYATATRCRAWDGWRFEKGAQEMSGARALIYSRIRKNSLDPSETDLDRARRQQQVIQATADRVTSFGTAVKLPFRGGSIVKPLATDLSAGQVLQLGWAYFRANTRGALHCRLGGEPGSADGQSVIFGSEDNVATISMFTGRSAPLQPQKGLPYAPGCVVGNRRL